MRAAAQQRPAVVDAAIATVLLLAVAIALADDAGAGSAYRRSDLLAYAVTLLGVLPYYWRSRFPLLVLILAAVPVGVLIELDYSEGALGVGLFLLVFTVAAHCPSPRRHLAWAVVVMMLGILAVRSPVRIGLAELVTNCLLVGAAFLLGVWAAERRRYTDWVEERARMLERDRERAAEHAVAEERLRIARELHDVVAHSMGVIAVQAGVGAHVIDASPNEAKAALQAISTVSRDALTDIRGILAALRGGGPQAPVGLPSATDQQCRETTRDSRETPDTRDPSPRRPTNGLAGLPELIRAAEAAGIEVKLLESGTRPALPVGIDLAVFRVVQESLTNAATHAPGSRAQVRIRYEAGAVDIEVTDDGPGPSAPTGSNPANDHVGLGLLGMTERVHAYGGDLQVGPLPGSGFRVLARIPYAGTDAQATPSTPSAPGAAHTLGQGTS